MAKRFSDSEKKTIRTNLHKLGLKRFSRQGIRGVRIDDLCRDVGISKGSFYNFYPSKEALFLAIAMEREKMHRQDMRTFLKQGTQSAQQLAEEFFQMLTEKIRTDPLLQVMIEHGEIEYLLRKIPPEQLQTNAEDDRRFLKELMTLWHGRFPNTDIPLETMEGLFSLMVVMLLQHKILPPEQMENALNLLRQVFVERLTHRANTARKNQGTP